MTGVLRPSAAPVRPYLFPAVARDTLPNGVRLIVAPMHRLPLVTVLALIDAGASADDVGTEGAAALTARTLAEGAGALDGVALVERFESLGTAFEASADWDSSAARFTALPTRLAEAFAQFAEVLRVPSFPHGDVNRRRDERLADLAQQRAEPRALADRQFTGALYAPSSRYHISVGGNDESVARLDARVVSDFHARRYGPANTTLVIVGDCTTERARTLALAAFGDWRVATTATEPVRAESASAGRRTVIVRKADAPQTELRIGHIGVRRSHPDHLAIVVMNAILGGLFSSRLNLNLRERNAFTYGASSGFDWRRAAGPFVASTAVKSEVTARAVEEILREIDAMRAAPPSAEEVSLATAYLAGVFPIRFETTTAVAGALAGATTHGLPDDWFATYRDQVQAIDAGAIHAAAQAHLDPERLLLLAVGDPATIESPLAALGHGPLTVRDAHEEQRGR